MHSIQLICNGLNNRVSYMESAKQVRITKNNSLQGNTDISHVGPTSFIRHYKLYIPWTLFVLPMFVIKKLSQCCGVLLFSFMLYSVLT